MLSHCLYHDNGYEDEHIYNHHHDNDDDRPSDNGNDRSGNRENMIDLTGDSNRRRDSSPSDSPSDSENSDIPQNRVSSNSSNANNPRSLVESESVKLQRKKDKIYKLKTDLLTKNNMLYSPCFYGEERRDTLIFWAWLMGLERWCKALGEHMVDNTKYWVVTQKLLKGKAKIIYELHANELNNLPEGENWTQLLDVLYTNFAKGEDIDKLRNRWMGYTQYPGQKPLDYLLNDDNRYLEFINTLEYMVEFGDIKDSQLVHRPNEGERLRHLLLNLNDETRKTLGLISNVPDDQKSMKWLRAKLAEVEKRNNDMVGSTKIKSSSKVTSGSGKRTARSRRGRPRSNRGGYRNDRSRSRNRRYTNSKKFGKQSRGGYRGGYRGRGNRGKFRGRGRGRGGFNDRGGFKNYPVYNGYKNSHKKGYGGYRNGQQVSRGRGRKRGGADNITNNHTTTNNKKQTRYKSKRKTKPQHNIEANAECYSCGKIGHFARNCKVKKAVNTIDLTTLNKHKKRSNVHTVNAIITIPYGFDPKNYKSSKSTTKPIQYEIDDDSEFVSIRNTTSNPSRILIQKPYRNTSHKSRPKPITKPFQLSTDSIDSCNAIINSRPLAGMNINDAEWSINETPISDTDRHIDALYGTPPLSDIYSEINNFKPKELSVNNPFNKRRIEPDFPGYEDEEESCKPIYISKGIDLTKHVPDTINIGAILSTYIGANGDIKNYVKPNIITVLTDRFGTIAGLGDPGADISIVHKKIMDEAVDLAAHIGSTRHHAVTVAGTIDTKKYIDITILRSKGKDKGDETIKERFYIMDITPYNFIFSRQLCAALGFTFKDINNIFKHEPTALYNIFLDNDRYYTDITYPVIPTKSDLDDEDDDIKTDKGTERGVKRSAHGKTQELELVPRVKRRRLERFREPMQNDYGDNRPLNRHIQRFKGRDVYKPEDEPFRMNLNTSQSHTITNTSHLEPSKPWVRRQ